MIRPRGLVDTVRFTGTTQPVDQTIIKVDSRLRYSELMKVINIFSDLKVNKISFAELGPDDEPKP